uniref:Uncharacterized protein n=1 Tax=Triticum urartu TaxID=4572 RepID=A0A8R7U7T7_TRIUA
MSTMPTGEGSAEVWRGMGKENWTMEPMLPVCVILLVLVRLTYSLSCHSFNKLHSTKNEFLISAYNVLFLQFDVNKSILTLALLKVTP